MKKFKILGIGLLLLFGFLNFSYGKFSYYNEFDLNSNQYAYIGDNSCFSFRYNGCAQNFTLYESDKQTVIFNATYNADGNNNLYCTNTGGYLLNKYGSSCTVRRYSDAFDCGGSCPECEECQECPAVDTGAILSGYIAISDVTTNYCTSNDLCPEMSGGNSAIYINDIRHESMPFINIRIPEEITRDYNYTGNGTQLDINVEGYGYDQEKMQNMVNTQFYKPTSEEMSGLIGKIADFLPLVAVALLIIRAWRVLKKVFRF